MTNIGLGAAVAPAMIGLDNCLSFGGYIGAGLMGESRLLHFSGIARFHEVPMRASSGLSFWENPSDRHAVIA